ncbi:flagellar export chaperone FliS [Tersicoccus sp. Bi-70]|uniref:flagellar export chaperone FliS n=1 Tax=Tersicoccus sp. Bi-70 TaxID=1897634 RepID=UPI00097743CB|nr:flagellar export chaperone FliS [Tersicoccus sp. Bi-70]OMH30579.1 flagellar export chaperone FliS [Tersicoccus sp. Bi-70]
MTTLIQARQRAQYTRDAVLSASPARLLTMLYDRLLLDLRRAEAAQLEQRWAAASTELLHAQDIITELSASLRSDLWDGAESLRGIYTYVHTALITANVRRDVERTREAIVLLVPLQESWHAAADAVPAPAVPAPAPGGWSIG